MQTENSIDVIQKKFPWYMQMDDLMGSSPVINRSAVAHSEMRVDLGILDCGGQVCKRFLFISTICDKDIRHTMAQSVSIQMMNPRFPAGIHHPRHLLFPMMTTAMTMNPRPYVQLRSKLRPVLHHCPALVARNANPFTITFKI